jgi:SAM-dependent methyltransferase
VEDRRKLLRETFDAIPELYDEARPLYPEELFDDLAVLADLVTGRNVLEIGCGTGQATVPLAERGYNLLCVELGPQLAAFAKQKLARFSNVQVVNAVFEDWVPGMLGFDAIVAFTSFHWVPPDVRYEVCWEALCPGGTLGVVGTKHVLLPDGDDFFVEVQADYEAVVPDVPETKEGPPGPPEAVGDLSAEMEASGLFRHVATRRYLWDVEYTADEYVAVLETHSGQRVLDPGAGRELLDRIHARAAARPGGRVRKTYLATLDVAERL